MAYYPFVLNTDLKEIFKDQKVFFFWVQKTHLWTPQCCAGNSDILTFSLFTISFLMPLFLRTSKSRSLLTPMGLKNLQASTAIKLSGPDCSSGPDIADENIETTVAISFKMSWQPFENSVIRTLIYLGYFGDLASNQEDSRLPQPTLEYPRMISWKSLKHPINLKMIGCLISYEFSSLLLLVSGFGWKHGTILIIVPQLQKSAIFKSRDLSVSWLNPI